MNKYTLCCIILFIVANFNNTFGQENLSKTVESEVSKLFLEQDPLAIDLAFSIKELKRNTNDSTYVDSFINYQEANSSIEALPCKLRVRGNYRLKNCYFPPLKIKLKKKQTTGTIFEGNKTLKIVVPCLIQRDNNDNVIKEYLAYKLFEIIAPHHFKTRLLQISLTENRGKKTKNHELKGFFIEDDKKVAKRFEGDVYKRKSHTLNHEALASVRNSMFQFMIGNTDYSSAYQHNMKVIFVDKKLIPLPYDFDMSGFVNTSYAVVSQIQGKDLGMQSVKQRKYRGFTRAREIFDQVRNEYLSNKNKMISLLNEHEQYFDDAREFSNAKDYIFGFFKILENDARFEKEIIKQARKQ